MIWDNLCNTVTEATDDVGISFGACHAIFKDILGMEREAAKFVLKFLNFKQKQHRLDIAQEMLTLNDNPDLLKKVITGNESWVYGYDIENKAQTSQCKRSEEQRPKNSCQSRSYVILIAWCIINSSHKFVWSIGNTTIEFCADCAKKFVRYA